MAKVSKGSKGEKVSLNEREFLLATLAEGRRIDGRGLYDYRTLKITFPYQPGYCEVQLGQTRVYVVVRCEVVEPYPDRPTEGFFTFNTEFSPMASQSFEVGGRVSEEAVEVGRLIERSLRDSRAIDTEALCIRAGEKVWAVQIDIHVLDDGGNLIDAASIATVAALLHFRRPDVSITGDAIVVHSVADREPVPLSIHHLPLCVTFAVFGEGERIVVDPWFKEEQTLNGRVTLIHNQHRELCGVHKSGGPGLPLSTLVKCSKIAAVKVQDVIQAIQAAIAAQPPTPTAIPRPFQLVAPTTGETVPPPPATVTSKQPEAAPAPKPTPTPTPAAAPTPVAPTPVVEFKQTPIVWDDVDDGFLEAKLAPKKTAPVLPSAVDSFLADVKKAASAQRVDVMDEEEASNGKAATTTAVMADDDSDDEEETTVVLQSAFAKPREADAKKKKKEGEEGQKEQERKQKEEKPAAKPQLPANDLSVAIKKKKKVAPAKKKTGKA